VTPLCDANNDDQCNVADVLVVNQDIFRFGIESRCARHPNGTTIDQFWN
jgi:hypothetical protein